VVRPHPLRVGLVGTSLAALVALPLFWLASVGPGLAQGARAALAGLAIALDQVGWVLVPQAALGVAVLGAALQRIASRAAGIAAPAPSWIDPAIESALLLGLLGTISGMVNGFVGLGPDELQPGPLVHSLGAALRSSFVGFAIALVGVWIRAGAEPEEASPSRARAS
jgi:hypothetical protein